MDLITNKEKSYHVSDMKPFIFDPLINDPTDVARKDYLEFFVEDILQHEGGNRSKKTQLSFLVKWVGYDDTHNSWEPYANLRDVHVLHDYLRSHSMSNHIPKKF